MGNCIPLNGEYIPSASETLGLESHKFKPMNLTVEFTRLLRIFCKENNITQDQFGPLINKPKHWVNKVLTGDWRIHAVDIPAICFAMGSNELLEILNREYNRLDRKAQLIILEEYEEQFIQAVAEVRLQKRQIKNQLKGR